MEWNWLTAPGEDDDQETPWADDDQEIHEQRSTVRCREDTCHFHDGTSCRFPWIEAPTAGAMDRGRCLNFLLEVEGGWLLRMNALF